MGRRTTLESEPVHHLRQIPFVHDLRYVAAPDELDRGYDGKIEVQTPSGRFQLLVETKRSFLTRSAVNQLLAWVKQVGKGKPHEIILLARHIPRPVAERLLEAQVNFADDVGNLHLALGDRYNWTVVRKPALAPLSDRRPISAAQLQLLFQLVTYPESTNWPVRQLETAAGISKSKAAQARIELVAEGLSPRKGRGINSGQRTCWLNGWSPAMHKCCVQKSSLANFDPPKRLRNCF